MTSPRFLIIGAQRGGTSSLYEYLLLHPQVAPAAKKEIHFFDLRFDKGMNWYLTQFPACAGGVVTGEASPYYVFHPHVPQRICRHLPKVKLIALLRNPVDRAYSHYQLEVRLEMEPLSFEKALQGEGERLDGSVDRILENETYYSVSHQHHSYLARGLYAEQIDRWRTLFDQTQMLLIKSEDFSRDPAPTLDRVCRFLDLDPAPWPRPFTVHNQSSGEPMRAETRRTLTDFYRPFNRRLSEMTSIDFDWE